MKAKFVLIISVFYAWSINAQTFCENFYADFEDNICLGQLVIDTSSNNLWQIGKPHKNTINAAYHGTHVIITDTLNAYSINNHSAFTISTIASYGDIYGFKSVFGTYNVHTDSLNDYGTIEFSPDNGLTWIDLIHDTVYESSIQWYSKVPVLTGNSHGWDYFELTLADNGSVFNLHLGDTIKYRFSFISDSIFDGLDGLAYDQFYFSDFVEGISETRFTPIKSKIYPNPAKEQFTIEFENPDAANFELAIYTIESKLVYTQKNIVDEQIKLNSKVFSTGVYAYKLTNIKDKKRSWGKFIISD